MIERRNSKLKIRSPLECELEIQMRAMKIQAPLTEFIFHPTRKWRFDFAWPGKMFAVEVEGGAHSNGRHTRGYGFVADLEKYHYAMDLGWNVYRCGAELIRSGQAVNLIQKIMTRLGDT